MLQQPWCCSRAGHLERNVTKQAVDITPFKARSMIQTVLELELATVCHGLKFAISWLVVANTILVGACVDVHHSPSRSVNCGSRLHLLHLYSEPIRKMP